MLLNLDDCWDRLVSNSAQPLQMWERLLCYKEYRVSQGLCFYSVVVSSEEFVIERPGVIRNNILFKILLSHSPYGTDFFSKPYNLERQTDWRTDTISLHVASWYGLP